MRATFAHSPQIARVIIMITIAVGMFAFMDAMSKYLTKFYPVLLVVWARYLFHTLIVVAVLWPRFGTKLVLTARPGAQVIRGSLLAGASLFFVGAIKFIPLANASAIQFISPLLVTILAVIFLKERVQTSRWVAILVGFAGVLIIVRPGSSLFTWASLLPLAAASCFASYQILTRRLAGIENPYTSNFYSGVVGLAALSLTLPLIWSPLQNIWHIVMFAAIGCIGGLSHLVMIKAYEIAPASRLAPFSYTQLIWASLAGYFVFNDIPDWYSIIGILVLMASGIFVATHRPSSERPKSIARNRSQVVD